MKMRPVWVVVHRYAGLAMALFLTIVGLTGSLLAFYPELDRWLNPQLSVAASPLPRLNLQTLHDKAERLAPQARITSIWLQDDAVTVALAPGVNSAGQAEPLAFNQLILNPYTGEELGRRNWGAISEGLTNLMPFVYKLHFALALGEFGIWILGITALVWTLDCFVGFYLTLPAARKASRQKEAGGPMPRRSFWQRWQPAWQVKWRGALTRVNFDLHRAGGLWFWAMLLVFAWSSVYMNLNAAVYAPVTKAVVGDYHEPWLDFPDLPKPLLQPALNWREAYALATGLMEQAAQQNGFTVQGPQGFRYNPAKGFYVYIVRSSADIQHKHGSTRLIIDANNGQQTLLLPSGQYAGNSVSSWLASLHKAEVFGLPYRIFVCLLGLVISMLSVTGVAIWWQKRRVRRLKKG